MLRIIIASLALTFTTGLASADRDNRPGKRGDNRPTAREGHNNHNKRVNRPGRANRRVVTRGPVRANGGRYVFSNGVTHTYRRPVISGRYYNVRSRPVLIVENYTPVPGYIWIRGQWAWGGREWRWNDGHYAADPQYSAYYDDGSYDYSVNIRIGG
jgi:hypothetical protein